MKAVDKKDYTIDTLYSLVREYLDSADLLLIEKAWNFAQLAHTGQKRFSGDPYVSHVLATAIYLASWKLDTDSLIAGLLHEAAEDGAAKSDDIEKEFGIDIADLVKGVSKLSYLKLRGSNDEEFVENLRKMFLAMAKDLRVIIIKMADRLHNMETLSAVKLEKRERIARETLEVFAPLAERLGMGQVKGRLEDLAFPYVYPEGYERVLTESRPYYKEASVHIIKMQRALLTRLAEEGVRAHIQAREKHLFSLWKKLQRPEVYWEFEKIHDIVAIRILVETIQQCYAALGIVHSLYKPVPHLGISDFIAQPKPNGYRSIHTKVFGPAGRIVEVQIRTFEMHDQAEHGVAAHWVYSEAKQKGLGSKQLERGTYKVSKSKLVWVQQLNEWQKEIKNSREFLRAVKFDALSERNFVFSPKGDVYELPKDATPIDFAYAVHTKLGNYLSAVKVNGKIVPLDYQLKSGDVVEIIKSKNEKLPSSKWLDIVVTNLARREINKHLRNSPIKR